MVLDMRRETRHLNQLEEVRRATRAVMVDLRGDSYRVSWLIFKDGIGYRSKDRFIARVVEILGG